MRYYEVANNIKEFCKNALGLENYSKQMPLFIDQSVNQEKVD